MSSIENNKVKILAPDGTAYTQRLGDIFPELTSITKKIRSEKEVLRYYNLVFKNKKQVQKSSPHAGKQHTTKSPGTNKGATRQKYVSFGYKTETRSAPNTRKGRKALRFMMNLTQEKMNKKQKKAMIYSMIYHLLKKAELYSYEKAPTDKTNKVLTNLKTHSYPILKNYFANASASGTKTFSPVLVASPEVEQYFHNYSKSLNLRTGCNYFGLYKGAKLRSVCIFQKEYLSELIKRLL